VGVGFLVVVFALAACSSDEPTVAEWEENWNATVALIPDESFLDDDPTEACQEVLVSLREAETDLFPTPDELTEDTVRLWLETAEGTFFDCPPEAGFPAAYDELDRLEAEVDASLTN
jgi:hypothetical protein